MASSSSSTLLSTVIPPAPVFFYKLRSPHVRFASLRHWYSRSEQTLEASEARLLSRLAFFTIGGKTVNSPENSKTLARVGLVDLDGDGMRKINTLVIDQKGNDFDIDKDGSIDETLNYEQLGFTEIPQTDLKIQSNTTTVDEEKNPSIKNLVMCHGFGGGLGFFYRNYHGLSQVPGWRIYSIDWLGMGRSSRPQFIIKGKSVDEYVQETENFFIESFEKWRKIHKIDKMTLLGHSLGGYLAAVYAIKYPMHVEKLILVSPVGVPRNPQNDPRYFKDGGRKIPGWIVKLWNAHLTPQLILRWLGPFGPSLVTKYTAHKFSHLEEIDQLDLHDYLYHISTAAGSGEFAITRILEPGAYARKPLIDRLYEIQMPTTFLYGEDDWMDYRAAEEAKDLMRVFVKIERVPKAGHHLYLDNPTEFNRLVIKEMLEGSINN
ncbi:6437_t:CDS:2 [Funneliformis geosporum]|uniref:6066_t:CDS:1 n=1 Tax=Funneliformis geosporum TaxID=1117311 RepID=A0A9W4WRC4_9GLOM|nr:6437_t:CDS:2 [Funneliformis geosporum]CAI2180604.1 6066_t:CDS:2 [Funneliformis geosporum]